jgi:hypothetical protein
VKKHENEPVTCLVAGLVHSWYPMYPVQGEEGMHWIRGHHAWDSNEVRAMRAAQALVGGKAKA